MKTFTIFSVVLIAILSPFPTDLEAQKTRPSIEELLGEPTKKIALTEFEKEILKWNYKGLQIGTTVASFKRLYPTAALQRDQSNPKIGQYRYWVWLGEGKDIEAIYVDAYNDKVYQVMLIYSVNFISNKVGGWNTFMSKMVKRFGYADDESKGTKEVEKPWIAEYFWQFYKADRYLGVEVHNEFLRLTIISKSEIRKVTDAKKKTVDLGF